MADDWTLMKSNTLEQRLNADRDVGKFTDVTFIVGPDRNQRIFKAHKMILAAGNAEFENMLYGTQVTEEVKIPDVSPIGFENLIRYLYGVNVEIRKPSVGRETYLIAEKFKEDKLKLATENNLIKLAKCVPFSEILQTAVELDIPRLKARCLEIMSLHFKMILESEEFTLALIVIIKYISEVYHDDEHEFWDWTISTLRNWIVDSQLPHVIAYHLISTGLPQWMPTYDFDVLMKSRGISFQSVILSIGYQFIFTARNAYFSKTDIFYMIKKNALASMTLTFPEIIVGRYETSGIENSSYEENVIVDQVKTGLKAEKNATDASEQQNKKEDDDTPVIGDDVIEEVMGYIGIKLKQKMSKISKYSVECVANAAEKAMEQASPRLQEVVDEALEHIEEVSCNPERIAKDKVDEDGNSMEK